MDPKQQALNNKQRERNQRGTDFQDEIRKSWRWVPKTWQLVIKDGGGGTRPADKLVLCPKVNILQELKRTQSKRFDLSFLEPNQIRGLVDFDQVIDHNYGVVLVSFHDPKKSLDECYAIRLTTALRYMQAVGKASIRLEDLRRGHRYDGKLLGMKIPREVTIKDQYDLRGLAECYKYL